MSQCFKATFITHCCGRTSAYRTVARKQISTVSIRLRRLNPRIWSVLLVLVVLGVVATTENLSAGATKSQITALQTLPSVTPNHEKMLALLKQIADQTWEKHIYIGDGRARSLRERLAAVTVQVVWEGEAPAEP